MSGVAAAWSGELLTRIVGGPSSVFNVRKDAKLHVDHEQGEGCDSICTPLVAYGAPGLHAPDMSRGGARAVAEYILVRNIIRSC